MTLGVVQKESRSEAGVTQQELGEELNLSRSMISEIEAGRRKMPRDVVRKATEVLDDGFYAMAAAQEVLGEGWIPKLNNVDLHRSAVREKALEELQEAMDQITATSSVNRPEPGKHDDLKAVLIECIDAIVCLSHFVAVYCKEYGLSWFGLWREHRRKMVERGYIKKKSAPLGSADQVQK
ncbi:helix-turn-helix domain-containing protein [Melghirimyces algeriensis]|uniref:Helix-turn-helix domain-containing protein n=1 Tax=Melghirimyces algeriensis TaxID=910412 RepID=A0A521C4M1_9BACL|nr:helix-turn-helix transcriptional regulator [Melghirimyces algeriensis]SMO54436.1 Helix-turn-helix domain-containing protein [Melghirimyces algeriensis]